MATALRVTAPLKIERSPPPSNRNGYLNGFASPSPPSHTIDRLLPMHLVLHGDSTLDNRTYTSGGPAVIDHLSRLLPEAARATLLAVDGAPPDGDSQRDRMPTGATHIVLSVGGNDAMREIPVVDQSVGHVSEALTELSGATQRFEKRYRAWLQQVLQTDRPTTV